MTGAECAFSTSHWSNGANRVPRAMPKHTEKSTDMIRARNCFSTNPGRVHGWSSVINQFYSEKCQLNIDLTACFAVFRRSRPKMSACLCVGWRWPHASRLRKATRGQRVKVARRQASARQRKQYDRQNWRMQMERAESVPGRAN